MTQESVQNQDFDPKINRSLDQALKKVDDAWFPVNPELLAKIQSGITSGVYDLDVEFLVGEIKTDFALFTYCVKELVKVLKSSKLPISPGTSPMHLFKRAGLQKLKEILSANADKMSAHKMGEMNDLQASRFKETMISASTAEVLSTSEKIDPELGFSTALFRQLGLTLIAWNYPAAYRRTITNLKDGGNLDVGLTRALGFSPMLLGITIARQWGVPAEIRVGMGDTEPNSSANVNQVSGSTISKLCEIGEALARANDPEHYPTAKADWAFAKEEVQKRVGGLGMRLIQERAKDNFESYMNFMPELCGSTIQVEPEKRQRATKDPLLTHRNRYLKECPPEVREGLDKLYTILIPGQVSKDGIVYLTKKIIPITGFDRGCIYLVDPENILLVPRLKIGTDSLNEFKPISCAYTAPGTNPVIAAFRCNSPIVEHGFDHQSRAFIAGIMGQVQRAGVVYLEMSRTLRDDLSSKPLTLFKAVGQAINDCLNLQ